jgi:arabinose-5-phosphate isomerase
MRTGDRLPVVARGQLVKEAVLAMTGARSGFAAVADENNVLLGIVTDGDLRRDLATGDDIMSKVVDEIMTPSPVTVRPEQLAAEVLRIFEEKDIDDILVVDGQNHAVGAVDIQDLPKLKIM